MLNIPGKTFLVGEYSVLVGGSALGIATEPYFHKTHENVEYHQNSAAGLYRLSLQKKNNGMKLCNPYGVGGMGFSTAEFISEWVENNKINFVNAFNDYKNLYSKCPGLLKIQPSGADLVFQMLGGITCFQPQVNQSKSYLWPFIDIDFFIISTGFKIKTHEYLSSLNLNELVDLPTHSNLVIESFFNKDKLMFFESLKSWTRILSNKNLQSEESMGLKKIIEENRLVILAKPNGALGADTLTVFFNIENKDDIKKQLKTLGLNILSGNHLLAKGVCYVD